MANVILSYFMPLLLGRTIDLSTYTLGGDIYDGTQFTEHPLMMVNSTYTVLQEQGIPYSQLGLPIDLILRMKAQSLTSGSGTLVLEKLLHDMSPKARSVSIALVSTVQTVKRELKEDAPLIPDWATHIEDHQTHYAHSLVYGGWSVVIYRFVCDVPAETEIVRRTLMTVLKPTGTVNDKTEGLWNTAIQAIKQNKDLNGKVSVRTHIYSSIPQSEDVTPDNFLQVISNFKNDVGPKGRPMFVELRPLHNLDAKFPILIENHDLDRDLEIMDHMFDDLRAAKHRLYKWMMESLTEFTDKEEKKIQKLIDEVARSTRFFYALASEASMYKPMDRKFIKLAFAMYNNGLKKHSGTYKQLYKRLREDLDPDCESGFWPKVKGMLRTTKSERREVGEVKGGVRECKTLCTREKRCRAIGYASTLPAGPDKEPQRKQCILYFRSTSTAPVIAWKHEQTFHVYDRKCNF